jgi:N-acetylmuramoyl-L-alanine amidase
MSALQWLLAVSLLLCAADTAIARNTGPARTQPIDMVVIHSTGGPTCDAHTGQPIWVGAGALDDNLRTIEAHPTLGIHYMIDRDGTLRTSVPEQQVAHHVLTHSARSIAVELVNDGDGRDAFAPAQIDALVALLQDIVRRHGIARAGIVRHSDLDRSMLPCTPQQRRKVDPGDTYPHRAVLDRVFGAH